MMPVNVLHNQLSIVKLANYEITMMPVNVLHNQLSIVKLAKKVELHCQ